MTAQMGDDTVNLDYAKMLRGRSTAAKALGNSNISIDYWQRYSDLKDTLNHQLLEGKAHEYAARYRLQEERLNTEREEAAKKRMGIIDSTARFSFTATYSVDGVCTGTNGTTKLFGTEGALDKSGITPYIDASYGKSLRIRVKTDGTEDEFVTWED